jgi:hypothetical protein
MQGFSFVMLYGGIAVSLLALASFLVFGPTRVSTTGADRVQSVRAPSARRADD